MAIYDHGILISGTPIVKEIKQHLYEIGTVIKFVKDFSSPAQAIQVARHL